MRFRKRTRTFKDLDLENKGRNIDRLWFENFFKTAQWKIAERSR